ncbi:MAG: dockerin type I domain-containing protein [Planctomycetota bacterium]|nr:dockerin type I domain-containing protein [Planctomycetota bacterium]
MVKGFRTVGLALAVVFFAAGSTQAVVSVDFIYSGSDVYLKGPTSPASGDTTTTPGLSMTNAAGLIFTGQSGAWNAVDLGGNNANVATAGKANLLDGSGSPTGVGFYMGTAADPASGGWRNNYSGGISDGSITGGVLRNSASGFMFASEQAYLYNGPITGPSFMWAFTGLQANATYNLVLFGDLSVGSNVANGMSGVLDSENDWNWGGVTADANGKIVGTFTALTGTPGIFGAQIASAATPANFTATPGSGPIAFGNVGVSTTATQTVTLNNIGGVAGNVTSASVTGDFILSSGTAPVSVAASGSAPYDIQLPAKTLPGDYAGTASFVTDTGTFNYTLTATVYAHAGDVNGDGQVSLLDYTVIKATFGAAYETGNHWGDGDVNGDEQVGLLDFNIVKALDFNIVKAHFGHTTGDGAAVTAVPEPASMVCLFGVAIPMVLKRRAKA